MNEVGDASVVIVMGGVPPRAAGGGAHPPPARPVTPHPARLKRASGSVGRGLSSTSALPFDTPCDLIGATDLHTKPPNPRTVGDAMSVATSLPENVQVVRYTLPLAPDAGVGAPFVPSSLLSVPGAADAGHQPGSLRVRLLEAEGLAARADGSACEPYVTVSVAELTRRIALLSKRA